MNDNFSDMIKIIDTLYDRKDAYIFRKPVHWQRDGLWHYPQVVKRPMDLQTVKENIMGHKYIDVEEVANDIRQIWINCMLFNRNGHYYYNLASNLAKEFESLYDQVKNERNIRGNYFNKVPTYEDKLRFDTLLLDLGSEELGRILEYIETNCPDALSAAQDKSPSVELNIDAIPPCEFHKLLKRLNASHSSKRRADRSSAKNHKKRRAS